MKIDPYCQRKNCNPLNVLFSNVQITLILLGVPPLEVYNKNRSILGENGDFQLQHAKISAKT